MVNFVKDGCVGDGVKHPRYGDGKIASLQGELAGYPVVVIFDGNAIDFTPEGRQHKGVTPELCFANGSCDIDQGSPPEREPEMCGDAMNVLQKIRDVLDTGEGFVDCSMLGDVKTKTISTPYGTVKLEVYNKELAKQAEPYGLLLIGSYYPTGTYRFILSDELTTKPKEQG